MTCGKTLKLEQIVGFKGKINQHFAKIFNFRATLWQTIKLQ